MLRCTFNTLFPMEVVEVQEKLYMFTIARVDRETVPDGLFAYDVADANDGEFWRIQKFVLVNHFGTIIGSEPITFSEENVYYPEPDPCNPNHSSDGNFLGICVNSVEEYKEAEKEYCEEELGGE